MVSRSSLPASILEKSRMSLITVEQGLGGALDHDSRYSRCSASQFGVEANSVMPMMPFMGVRIS